VPTRILGLSAYYHDSAACLVEDGRIVAAAQEERFTRKKHDPGFPVNAVAYCLREAGIAYRDLEKSGVFLVVTEASCSYRSAARYDEELEVRTRVDHVGKATIGFAYRVLGPQGALLAEGRTVLASVDASKNPVRLPRAVTELLPKS